MYCPIWKADTQSHDVLSNLESRHSYTPLSGALHVHSVNYDYLHNTDLLLHTDTNPHISLLNMFLVTKRYDDWLIIIYLFNLIVFYHF